MGILQKKQLLFLPPFTVGVNSKRKEVVPGGANSFQKSKPHLEELPYPEKKSGIHSIISGKEAGGVYLNRGSVLPKNFITGDNVPRLLKKWGHLRKKWGHCGKNDGTVIWRSKFIFTSVYIITDHILTFNKQY